MSIGLELYKMDKVDLHDPVAVKDRITEYFRLYGEADVKPTVTGLGMALGVDSIEIVAYRIYRKEIDHS